MADDPNVEVDEELEEKEEVDGVVFTCSSRCIFIDSELNRYEDFEGKVELYKKKLIIYDNCNSPLDLKYEDIVKICGGDYEVKARLYSGDEVLFKELGFDFEDFLNRFSYLFNEFIIENLPMEDKKGPEFNGEYIHFFPESSTQTSSDCRIRICEKSVLIISPENGPVRIPYSLVSKVLKEDYSLIIETDYDESFTLRGFGGDLDNLESNLNTAIGKFSSRMQAFIKEVMPKANSLLIRKVSNLMRDGRAVSVSDIKSCAPQIIKSLEDRITACGSRERYEFVNSLSVEGLIHMGLKKGLMGGLESDYIWTFSPVPEPGKGSPGNLLVMEVLAPEKEGKATYFFRIMPWREYEALDEEELKNRVNVLIKLINKCMLFIDFKREPIYISQNRLEDPENLKYKIALTRLPELSLMRDLYIGRVIHSSIEQWKKDVNSLIAFAYNERKDNVRWKK